MGFEEAVIAPQAEVFQAEVFQAEVFQGKSSKRKSTKKKAKRPSTKSISAAGKRYIKCRARSRHISKISSAKLRKLIAQWRKMSAKSKRAWAVSHKKSVSHRRRSTTKRRSSKKRRSTKRRSSYRRR